MTWYLFRCPNCKFAYKLSFKDKPRLLRCPTSFCKRWYTIQLLESLYHWIGEFQAVDEQTAERWEKEAFIEGFRDAADELEGKTPYKVDVEVEY